MSAIYITNGLGQYLSIGEDGTASLSSSPVSIDLTKADEEGNFDTGRYDANNTHIAWTLKASGNGTYTIGCHLPDTYGTAFLYASDQGLGDAKGFMKTGDGIALSYQEPSSDFTAGQWHVTTDITAQEVKLNEKESYVRPNLTSSKVNVTLTRTLYAKEWNSFCVPFPISTEQIVENWGEGTTVAEFFDVNGTRLLFKTCQQIEAGKPYVLLPSQVKESNEYSFQDIDASTWSQASASTSAGQDAGSQDITTKVGLFQYIGKYEPTTVPARAYVFGDGDKMYHLTSAMTMNGFRAYFWDTATGTSAAKQLTWGFGDPSTAIEIIPGNATPGSQAAPSDIYKLDGKLVKRKATSTEGLAPGVYIMHGMKVVVK